MKHSKNSIDFFNISYFLFGSILMLGLFWVGNSGSTISKAWNTELIIDDKLKREMTGVCEIDPDTAPIVTPLVHNAVETVDKALTFGPAAPSIAVEDQTQCIPTYQVSIDVYMYHYVRPSHRDSSSSVVHGNSITPEAAREHYQHLSKLQLENKIKVVFLSELEKYQESNCFPHENIIVLTFDDGRRDNYHYLLPLAREFDIKANLAIVANRIAFSEDERIDSFMLFEEVQRMKDSGYFELQSHTGTHTNLQAKNYAAQRADICDGTKYLEDLFDVSMNSIIYPMGLYNQTSMNVARDCGLRYGFTTIEGSNSVADLSNYAHELSRWRVHKGSTPGNLYGW